ncbi:MAG: hypothetical protein IKS37_07490 [Solobacterium sp.]|nr:hypothetical protein [Solobacterium sp.]
MLKKGQILHANNGKDYTLLKKLGAGGQAVVWKVRCHNDGKLYAYKHYKQNRMNVRANIEDLIRIGHFVDSAGNVLDNVILPITIVEGEGESFGYVMELVDLQDFITIAGAFNGTYPDAKILCRIIRNFAHVFETLHLTYGMCYKDVNEGNIFFHPLTGEIRIIDNDNIGYSSKFTIKGTSRYIAPEVWLGEKPNHNSDRFSFAVYVFRLLTGGWPFDGPYSEAYCQAHNMLAKDAAPVIYGSDACFIWHPTDHSNSIESSNDARLRGQVTLWKRLPQEFKDLFLDTFVTNLSRERAAERPTDADWKAACDHLEASLVTCRHCHALTFEAPVCLECGKRLRPKQNAPAPLPTPIPTPAPVPAQHHHSVTLKVLSAGEAKKEISLAVSERRKGREISINLTDTDLLHILYSKKQKKLGIRNCSDSPWIIIAKDKQKSICAPGDVQTLEEGMMIRIIPKTAQLNVLRIQ